MKAGKLMPIYHKDLRNDVGTKNSGLGITKVTVKRSDGSGRYQEPLKGW